MRHFAKAESQGEPWGWSRIETDVEIRDAGTGMLSNQHAESQQSILQLVVVIGPSTIWMNSEEFLEQSPNKNKDICPFISTKNGDFP